MPFVRSNQVLSLRFSSKRLPPALVEAARDGLNWLLGFRSFNEVYRRLTFHAPISMRSARARSSMVSLSARFQLPDL